MSIWLKEGNFAHIFKIYGNMVRFFRLCAIFVSFLCATECFSQHTISVIPQPQWVDFSEGTSVFQNNLRISSPSKFKNEAKYLAEALKLDFKISASLTKSSKGAEIILETDKNANGKAKEGYKLAISNNKIRISAAENAGIFYGIQSLLQMLSVGGETLSVKNCTITDCPAYGWREMMLDEARYFQGKAAVKKLLDEMARLKLNVFHWHLTDDQGWRIEIKKYPNLTKIGSKRPCTGKAYYWNSSEFDETPHEGFYTQADIKEIVAYAEKLHITIVPEIEVLTHATAAIASYPWLGTTGDTIGVECRMGTCHEVMNIANPMTMQFIYDVLDEVMALFPSKYIHVGGDEIMGDHWKQSTEILKMKQGLGITEDFELQIYFLNKLSEHIAQKHRHMIAWSDGIGSAGKDYKMPVSLAPGTVLQYWTGNADDLNRILDMGLQVIQSHTDGLYFNAYLPQAYQINCIPENIAAQKHKQFLGLGVELWTEFDATPNQMFDHAFPRIAAYAETAWSEASKKNYDDFRQRLQPLLEQWKARGINVGGMEENQ